MSGALRLTSARIALIVATLAGVALCFSALLGTPGVESALVLGVLLPPFCGAVGVRIADAERGAPVGTLVTHAMAVSFIALAIPVALFTLNMARVPICTPLEGLAFLALGPGAAVALSATVGVVVGALLARVRIATAIAVLVPLVAAGFEIWSFYASPAIFGYGHFFGYFPGTLYDPDVSIGATYVSFRLLSLAWWGTLTLGLGALWDPATRRLDASRARERWPVAVAALALCVGAIAGEWHGDRLGHFSTAASIAEALGGRTEGERCDVVHPRETPRAVAIRLAAECDFRVRRVEEVLGVHQASRVTAFFFRSAQEKRALMGASTTYIAKPWRDEVYLQMAEWPHPVLFHEIVHVVAGNIGVGPFRISGTAGGILPSPAIIEGVAVAVAWSSQDGLTPHQWARAMLEVDLAPPLRSVEGLEFLLQPASRAYTASGSFVRWMMETLGTAAVRRLYLTGDWEEALGQPLEEAEAQWHEYLREEVDLPDEARALARARFEQPGIFGQICPHAIANLRVELAGDLAAGDDEGAVGRCREILDLDEGQTGTRTSLAGALARLDRQEEAAEELARLVGPPSAAMPLVQRARQELADADWRLGNRQRARATYEALLGEPMSADAARQIEVRRIGVVAGGATEQALLGLLLPPADATNDPATTMFEIGRLAAVRDDGLAPYLQARQLLFRERFTLALPRIIEGRVRGLPTPRMELEARRIEAVIRLGAGDGDGSARLWRRILHDGSSGEAERVEARDWLARIRLSGG